MRAPRFIAGEIIVAHPSHFLYCAVFFNDLAEILVKVALNTITPRLVLYLLCPMLPVALDCSFLIAPFDFF